ncbi:MAG: sugar phosphate isomerase/epimerase [Armatimonadetes bacterium]|nr:sugar phosphate isomerase/epimerase [Armatimonadota bacterium]
MRLGAHLYKPFGNAEEWAAVVKGYGYSAAYCPIGPDADDATVAAYADAAARHDIIIAEVGAWSNPISPDPTEAAAALDKCQQGLALADRIGARCCVNIAGARGQKWDGPHPDNLSPATFDLIVQSVREIIDTVQPTRSFYTLETMPWVPPHTPQSYADLIAAIDRPQCAVHLDPVNMVNGVLPYVSNAAMIRESFALLGPMIRSCHAKDIRLEEQLTTHLNEVRPGLGGLDYRVYLEELSQLEPDVCLMIEHLPSEEEYLLAVDHIRAVAAEIGVSFI